MSEEEYNGDRTSFLVYSGQKDPYFTGGLNLNIRYHSFTLGTTFSLLLGGVTRLKSPYRDMQNGSYMPDPDKNLNKDKNIIANLYSTTGACLENWIQCVTTIRNRCAHYSRFYDWEFR